jgi:hypothetical protein
VLRPGFREIPENEIGKFLMTIDNGIVRIQKNSYVFGTFLLYLYF